MRPYHSTYHPMGWRCWWDFGNGRIGDMGCHMIDLPFTALELKSPLRETVLLGAAAFRAGEKLEWDAQNLKITDNSEAERFI